MRFVDRMKEIEGYKEHDYLYCYHTIPDKFKKGKWYKIKCIEEVEDEELMVKYYIYFRGEDDPINVASGYPIRTKKSPKKLVWKVHYIDSHFLTQKQLRKRKLNKLYDGKRI